MDDTRKILEALIDALGYKLTSKRKITTVEISEDAGHSYIEREKYVNPNAMKDYLEVDNTGRYKRSSDNGYYLSTDHGFEYKVVQKEEV